LQRMRELAVQSANDTNTDDDRGELQKEVNQLAQALDDIAENTEFNTQKLLNGELDATTEGGAALTFHVGANEGQNLTVEIADMSSAALEVAGEGGNGGIDISSQTNADTAITTIQEAIDAVSGERSKLGAVQNRLDHTINNLGTSAENITDAESRIRDVDYDVVA